MARGVRKREQAPRTPNASRDIILPNGPTGSELAEDLRTQRPGLKVIFMTGHSGEVVARETGVNERTKSHFMREARGAKRKAGGARRLPLIAYRTNRLEPRAPFSRPDRNRFAAFVNGHVGNLSLRHAHQLMRRDAALGFDRDANGERRVAEPDSLGIKADQIADKNRRDELDLVHGHRYHLFS